MLGPRLDGANGVSLRTLTLEDDLQQAEWMLEPEATRFWGWRTRSHSAEELEKRFKENAKSDTSVNWSIYYGEELVGMTGLFGIDWVTRDGESGIFIGRSDLYGKGIASEAIRLRTAFAWEGLRLHRVHNWIVRRNRGSRRANEKAGYRQFGVLPKVTFTSGQWHDEWMGEIMVEDLFRKG
jgi:RimJ/RimL family protein N-acetyltransferase